MVAALCLFSTAAELSAASANRSATPAPAESMSIGGAAINVEIEAGDLSRVTHSGHRMGSKIGLRRNRILRRVSRSKRRREGRADRRRQGRTLRQDSRGRSNSRDTGWLIQARY